jgi:hypothetical protein
LTKSEMEAHVRALIEAPPKRSHLSAALFVSSFAAVMIVIAFRRVNLVGGRIAAVSYWTASSAWTAVCGVCWKTSGPADAGALRKNPPLLSRRVETMWFRLWKGVYLGLLSAATALTGIGMVMEALSSDTCVVYAVLAVVLLSYLLAFAGRWRILRLMVTGWSPHTRPGRLMRRLERVGPLAAAAGASLGMFLVRSEILPREVVHALGGFVAVFVAALAAVPVVQDLMVARIHRAALRGAGRTC